MPLRRAGRVFCTLPRIRCAPCIFRRVDRLFGQRRLIRTRRVDGRRSSACRPVAHQSETPLDGALYAARIRCQFLDAAVVQYALLSPASVRATRRAVSYESFFYPLDAISQWNRLYGPRGFQQYQCVIPERCAEAGIAELLRAIADSGRGSFLAVLKRCGDLPSPGLLSFPMPGVSLALDFPQRERVNHPLFDRLDAIVRHAEGRLYPAKDAHMSGADFRRAYPAWERIEALRDPALCSRFWKRVTQI